MSNNNVVDLSVKKRPVRVGVVCSPGLDNFISDIVVALEKTYDVRTYYGNIMEELEDVIKWSDILWIEWANELCIHITNNVKELLEGKKVIVRLHSYEALSGFCQQINWEVIDVCVFVASHIKDIADTQVKLPSNVRIAIIPNGVDLEKFKKLEVIEDEKS